MNKIKTVVIGVGSLGKHHARILSTHPMSELVGVVDADKKRAEGIAKDCNCPYYENYSSILSTAQAAVIAVPTPYHYKIAKDLISAGIHCLVEKPFTETVEEAEELISLARDKNIVVQVGLVERFNPAIAAALPYITNPRFVEVNRLGPYDPRTSHIGVVLDLMIHDIDILLYMLKDKVVGLDAYGAKVLSDNEDIVKVRLKFSKGCVADISASRVSLERFRKIRVFQNDSYISVDYIGRTLKIYKKKKEKITSLLDIDVIKPKTEQGEPLYFELTNFLQSAIEGKRPLVTGEHGRDALEIALEIRKSIKF